MLCMAIPHLDSTSASSWLAAARVEESVWALRPDYVAVMVVATGLTPGPSDAVSEAVLREAETSARAMLGDGLPESVGHVTAWREAYRGFGAKPQRTRSSVEALLRRVGDGLPRIDRLTDAYNAVSIANATPLGGEDLEAYAGPLRLVRASGDEEFEVMSGGARASEPPEPGEVVWRDDLGVTCRRWNWRQCVRTRLTESSTSAVFICDVLDVEPGDASARAAVLQEGLVTALQRVSPGVELTTRTLRR
jgi:DNA/RNA-binding domain of Phe-tRNA-synthetase-like protein